MKNLPVRSQSRGVQPQHTRSYPSGKITTVNRGVKKPTSKPKIVAKKIVRVQPKPVTVTQKIKLLPRKSKQQKAVKEQSKLEARAKELGIHQDVNGIWLLPGEVSYKHFKGIRREGWSVMGELMFEDWDGNIVSVPTELRSSNGGNLSALEEFYEVDKSVIVGLEEDFIVQHLANVREYEDLPLKELVDHVEEVIKDRENGEPEWTLVDADGNEVDF